MFSRAHTINVYFAYVNRQRSSVLFDCRLSHSPPVWHLPLPSTPFLHIQRPPLISHQLTTYRFTRRPQRPTSRNPRTRPHLIVSSTALTTRAPMTSRARPSPATVTVTSRDSIALSNPMVPREPSSTPPTTITVSTPSSRRKVRSFPYTRLLRPTNRRRTDQADRVTYGRLKWHSLMLCQEKIKETGRYIVQ